MQRKPCVTLVAVVALGLGCLTRQSLKVIESDEIRQEKVAYEGGSGESADNAIVIEGAMNRKAAVAAEYDFISKLHGKKGKGWRLDSQSRSREGERVFDILEIHLIGPGTTRYYYFDITHCSWHGEVEEE